MADLTQALARFTQRGLHEKSVKITADGLDWDRCLYSFPRSALLPGPIRRFGQIADDLDLDAAALLPHLKAATHVHVGVESGGYKLYLEFGPGELAFLAVKRGNALNTYYRVMAAKGVVAKACADLGGDVLEVKEAGSARVSYDVHLADAGLTVGKLPKLDKLLADFKLPADSFTAITGESLGHFASGKGADKKAFATIYYGARHDP